MVMVSSSIIKQKISLWIEQHHKQALGQSSIRPKQPTTNYPVTMCYYGRKLASKENVILLFCELQEIP